MESEAAGLSAVIGDIYDASVDPSLWNQALGSICAFVGGSSAALYWHDAATERSEALHLFNEDPVYTRLYFEKYLPMNPMFPAATFIDVGVVTTSEDVMPTIADLLGLSQATVKTHLQNVFRKTGTKRQSDLVKLVAGM